MFKDPSFVKIFNLLLTPVTCAAIRDLSASLSLQLIGNKSDRILVGRLIVTVSVTRSKECPQLKETLACIVTGSEEIQEERDRLAAATEDVEAVIEVDG